MGINERMLKHDLRGVEIKGSILEKRFSPSEELLQNFNVHEMLIRGAVEKYVEGKLNQELFDLYSLVQIAADVNGISFAYQDAVKKDFAVDFVLAQTGKNFVRVFADKDLTYRAIYSIMNNACGFARNSDGKVVATDLHYEGDYGILTIMNSGEPLNNGLATKIFQERFSGKESSGLGLAGLDKIFREMNGEISAEGKIAGTWFTLKLPRTQYSI